MKLSEYMAEAGLTDARLAEHLGVDRSTVTRWRNGTRPPLWAAVKIEQLSGGAVRPSEFIEERASNDAA